MRWSNAAAGRPGALLCRNRARNPVAARIPMASRKGRKQNGSRGASLTGRVFRRVAVTLLAVLIAAAIWTAWIYFRTPRQDRNLRAAATAALDRAEDLYAKAPHDTGPLKKLPAIATGGGKSADPNAEAGKLDQPF